MQPAGAAVRRRLPAGAGQPAAVKQDERMRELLFGRDEILDIDLLDEELAVGVVFQDQARRKRDGALLLAGYGHDSPADMEAAEIP